MALNKDQEQLLDWYEQGKSRVAFRHGLSEPIMSEWLSEQGYYGMDQSKDQSWQSVC